jgi:hypothetical protein
LSACKSDAPFSADPPDGWVTEGSKWWTAGTDTALAFRDLTSLSSMDVEGAEVIYSTGGSRESFQHQIERAVKESLIEIIRNEPEVVDSLLELVVIPKVRATSGADATDLVQRYKLEGYRSISRHFREPRQTVQVGSDIPLVFPDSLREAGVAGAVGMQLYLDVEGVPTAIWLINSVHPVLDAMSMQATAQARWQPAYLLRGGKSDPIPSWVRYRIRFDV